MVSLAPRRLAAHGDLPYLRVPTVFCAYRDSPQRRAALAAPLGSADRYLLFGLDQLAERGWGTTHGLERGSPPAWARGADRVVKGILERAGGYGGDFATALGSLRRANRTDVILSTVDTVGIPLMLLNRAGRIRPPLVYVAVGLPERLALLRTQRMRGLYADALARSAAVLAYSEYEAEGLRTWLAAHGGSTHVEFVPFGVDEQAFVPANLAPAVDVVTIGADPHRDLELLLRVAAETPTRSFRIVTTSQRARELGSLPGNVEVETDLPFEAMRVRLAEARAVALPVRDNSYSGATTVLLQAMASGKPVVVSRTKAIASGYGLVDGENCRLVEPGDAAVFQRALGDVLRDEWHARALGATARRTVEEGLTWSRYVDRIEKVLRGALAASADARSGSV
jgi:glycosyltransferase involved in cell wall biosynthesis